MLSVLIVDSVHALACTESTITSNTTTEITSNTTTIVMKSTQEITSNTRTIVMKKFESFRHVPLTRRTTDTQLDKHDLQLKSTYKFTAQRCRHANWLVSHHHSHSSA